MEEWKDIKGYEGLYMISSLGRVKSLQPRGGNRNGMPRKGKEHILTPYISSTGYYKVSLVKNNKRSDKRIHRLLASAFIPNPNNKPNINHIDGNKLNNRIDNLEWCTQKENTIHAIETGLRKVKSLTKDEMIELYVNQHLGIKQIAKQNNISYKKVKDYLILYNISKHKGRKYELSIDDIKRDINNGMSNKEIANKYKCSYGIISIRKHQIKKGLI